MNTITVNVSQLPVTPQHEQVMRWNCDEFIIQFDRKTMTITVEEFEGFEDDGTEICYQILDVDWIKSIVEKTKIGWIGLDGFVRFDSFYPIDSLWISDQPI